MKNPSIGVDLGGSHVTAAVVDESGTIVDRFEQDIVKHDFDDVVKIVAKVVEEAVGSVKGRVEVIGVGSPGGIDAATGVVHYSPNFSWYDVPLGARLSERLGRPVIVANDASCATLGEHTYGIGRGTRDFVLLTLGTGIGSGIVAGGELLLGHAGGAGELGHHQIRATDGFACTCGKIGCFEAQASGTGLIRHALTLAPSFPRSELVSGKPANLGSKSIGKAAQNGDAHALAAWTRYVTDLAIGITNLIGFVNPELIALGGGVAAGAGDFLISALVPRVDELTRMIPRGGTRIEAAALGNDAGAIGASIVARQGGLVVVKA